MLDVLALVRQTELEGISEQLRIPGSKALGPVSKVRLAAGRAHALRSTGRPSVA